jgi:cell division septation protein DedD
LGGYRIGDQEDPADREGVLEFPPEASLQSGEMLIIAQKANAFQSQYGFLPHYEIAETDLSVPNLIKVGGTFNLTNSGDEILVWDSAGSLIDAVAWGSTPWRGFIPAAPAPREGQSLERYPAYADTNTTREWRVQVDPSPGKVDTTPPTPLPPPTRTATKPLTPTPGPTNTPTITPTSTPAPTPFGGMILISEVVYNPAGAEPAGEWVELYNPQSVTHNLQGFILGDDESTDHGEARYRFPENTYLAPGQAIVIAFSAIRFQEIYGRQPDFEFSETDPNVPNLIKLPHSGNFNLSNQGDEVILWDSGNYRVDSLVYGNSTDDGCRPPASTCGESASIERFPPDSDTDSAADWRCQTAPSPGSVAPAAPTPTPSPTQTTTPAPSATPTETPTPTPSAVSGMGLNENRTGPRRSLKA